MTASHTMRGLLAACVLGLVACSSPTRQPQAAPSTTVPVSSGTTTTTATVSTVPALNVDADVPHPADPTVTTAPVTPGEPAPNPAPTATEPWVELGRLVIPAIGVDETVHEGITLHGFDRGPGHWPGTATIGEAGTASIGGHRVSRTRPFRNLDRLKPGDQIEWHPTNGPAVTFTVDTAPVFVEPDTRAGFETITGTGPTETRALTLFACHPPGSTELRVVVHATAD